MTISGQNPQAFNGPCIVVLLYYMMLWAFASKVLLLFAANVAAYLVLVGCVFSVRICAALFKKQAYYKCEDGLCSYYMKPVKEKRTSQTKKQKYMV